MRGRHRLRAHRGLVVYQLVLILIILGVIAWLLWRTTRQRHVQTRTAAPAAQQTSAGALDTASLRQTPTESTFEGCPPTGDGGDRVLNRLKNRVDAPRATISMSADSVLALPWPASVNKQRRARWSHVERDSVDRWEGLPVSVSGYLVQVKREGPESPNCHGADPPYRDWHMWLGGSADDERARAVVVETTPRVRAQHPAWTLGEMRDLVSNDAHVRVTGWLLLDQEHPEELSKSRGTLWEIHPITAIEVERNGRWVSLDSLTGRELSTRGR